MEILKTAGTMWIILMIIVEAFAIPGSKIPVLGPLVRLVAWIIEGLALIALPIYVATCGG